ncbi:MAG: hypothetical protein U0X20_25800 [Caldilineaceae bacterium]
MGLAHGTVKHFGLHRLDNVELRVVADDETGILRVEQAEIDVVGRLSGDTRWQHKTVTMFVLSDLQPLQRQLEALGLRPADVRLQERDELLSRPVLNVYDLASPATCNVFVNRKAMIEAKYWEDSLALEGLFAHEHAHPLSECAYTAALRTLRIEVQLQLEVPWAQDGVQDANWAARSNQQIGALAAKLFSTGAREVFTNGIAVAAGFDRALYHLNRENIANLALGLKFRPALAAQIANVVAQGQLSPTGADMLRLIGDMQAFLPLAMEIAPFKREHCAAKARELVRPLHVQLLPQLERPVAGLFDDLVDLYTHADEAAVVEQVRADVECGLARLAQALAEVGAKLAYKVEEVRS